MNHYGVCRAAPGKDGGPDNNLITKSKNNLFFVRGGGVKVN